MTVPAYNASVSSGAGGTGGSATVTLSSAPLDGDLLCVVKSEKIASGDGVLPAPFTTLHALVSSGGGLNASVRFGYWHARSAGTTYTFSGITGDYAIFIFTYRSTTGQITIEAEAAQTGSGATAPMPSITVAHSDLVVGVAGGVNTTAFESLAPSAPLTGRSGTSITDVSTAAGDISFGPGTASGYTFTSSDSTTVWATWAIAIQGNLGGIVIGRMQAP